MRNIPAKRSGQRPDQAQVDWIRVKLENAEQSGFTSDTKEQILKQSKALLNG